MTMQYDVKSTHTEATGTLLSGRVRIKGFIATCGGTGGDVVFRDGGASGTTRLTFNIPVTAAFAFSTVIPGEGILFNTDVHVTLPTSAKITVFYG